MSDREAVQAVIDRWMECLDAGDLDGMLATCDPDVVVANERQPTTVGVEAVREKYAPQIAAARTKSSFETRHIAVYGDYALVVGNFEVDATDKKSGQSRTATGRLALNYRRHQDGQWKMVFDMDNNA